MVEVTHGDEMLAFAIVVHLNAPRAQEDYIARQIATHREAAAKSGRDAGIIKGLKMAAKAIQDDAKLCDCSAWEESECACGAWCEWKTIPSHRAVEIVRALIEEQRPIGAEFEAVWDANTERLYEP